MLSRISAPSEAQQKVLGLGLWLICDSETRTSRFRNISNLQRGWRKRARPLISNFRSCSSSNCSRLNDIGSYSEQTKQKESLVHFFVRSPLSLENRWSQKLDSEVYRVQLTKRKQRQEPLTFLKSHPALLQKHYLMYNFSYSSPPKK